MSDLRTAAQQALKALHEIAWCNDSRWQTDRAESVIPALRAALAQQTQTPCDIAEDGVCEALDCCRKLPLILEALEIGYASAEAEAAQYHAAMAGYRPERHAAMDADAAKIAAAITAVKAALAQAEQEPTVRYKCTVVDNQHLSGVPFEQWQYSHPPRREWQGLTDDEISALFPSSLRSDYKPYSFARAVEAALKEKNHG
jgi:hypothetical protein